MKENYSFMHDTCVVHLSDDDERIRLIQQGLNAHNARYGITRGTPVPFAFALEDEKGGFLGGIKGKIIAGWGEIGWLYSTGAQPGTGTALVRAAEDFCRAQDAHGMVVDTYGFQAPDFYRKLGYGEFGRIENYIGDHAVVYLYKRFNDTVAKR